MPVFADNKKARFNYQIIESIQAGMILSGGEVKSVRASKVSFTNAYVLFLNNKPILRGLHIAPYGFSDNRDYNPERDRELLLSAQEIKQLQNNIQLMIKNNMVTRKDLRFYLNSFCGDLGVLSSLLLFCPAGRSASYRGVRQLSTRNW